MDTTDNGNAQMSSNNLGGGGGSSGKFSGEHDSECSSVTSDSAPGGYVEYFTTNAIIKNIFTILVCS